MASAICYVCSTPSKDQGDTEPQGSDGTGITAGPSDYLVTFPVRNHRRTKPDPLRFIALTT
jgi:hypothetical protein